MRSNFYPKSSRTIFFSLSLTTLVTLLGLTAQKAKADFFVSNTNNSAIDNYDPITGEITDAFTVGQSSILEYDNSGNFIRTFVPAGTGQDNLSVSTGITFGPDGNLYANDFANNSVKEFNRTTGAYIRTFIPSGSGGLHRPEDLVFDQGDLYVSQLEGGGVNVYNATTGAFIKSIATTIPGTSTSLDAAVLTVDFSGNLYIGSVFNDSRVLRYNPTTGYLDTFIPPGSGQPVPAGMTFGSNGNFYLGNFLTSSSSPNSIAQYDGTTGAFLGDFVTADSSTLSQAARLTFGPDGNLYASSFGSSQILTYNGQTGANLGTFIDSGYGGLSNPTGIAFTPVPEPRTIAGTVLGLVGLGLCKKKLRVRSIEFSSN